MYCLTLETSLCAVGAYAGRKRVNAIGFHLFICVTANLHDLFCLYKVFACFLEL